jgi:hypothetical protein
MRKIYSFMVAAVALFAAASCAKELPQENLPAGETVVYSASFDQAETKAVLNETKLQSEWVAGDAITVLDGAKAWNFTTTQAGTDADFANSEGFGEYRPVVAVYPKGAWTANLAEKTVNAYISTWQQAQKGTYHADAALAVAYSENNEFSFKNAHALLKFQVNADNVTHLVFHGNNEEAFTGNMLVTLGDDNTIASVVAQDTEFTEGDNKRIGKGTWVECYAWQSDDEKYFEKGATYYIAVAPQVFENGVSVKIRINEGAETLAKTTTKKVEVKRNTIVDLGVIEYVAPETTWGIVGAVNAWGESGADLPMSKTETDGLFVAKNVDMPAGDFKIRANGQWNDEANYGLETAGAVEVDHVYNVITSGGSGNMTLVAGKYDIWFDLTNKKVYIMTPGKPISEAVQPEDKPEQGEVTVQYWAVVGSMTEDWASEVKMTLDGDWYVVENVTILKTDQFKFRANGSWTAPNRGAEGEADGVVIANDTETKVVHDGKNFSVAADGIYTLSINKAADKAKVVKTGEYVAPEEKPQVGGEKSIWGIVGDVNGWAAPDIAMLTTETKDLFVAKNVTLPKGGFKIRANGAWNDAANYGLSTSGNVKVDCYYTVETSGGSGNLMTEAGTYDIWFDLAGKKVYIMTPGKDISAATAGKAETPQTSTWYLVGSFNGWNTSDAKYKMVAEGGYYVVKNVTLAANAEVKACDGSWNVNRGGSFAGVDKACSVTQGGSNIKVTKAGTYDVYLNSDATKMYFMTPGKTPAN